MKYIKDMTVRGAPAIGAAGAFGMVLQADNAKTDSTCVIDALSVWL